MTVQIAVRLPEELVEFIDAEITANAAPNRTQVVTRALERERRRRLAERDAAIYREHTEDDDLDSLARWVRDQPLDVE